VSVYRATDNAEDATDPALALDCAILRTMHQRMALTREIDIRSWILSRQGKAHFVITGRGHEAAQVGSALALRPGTDMVFPYYRDLGVAVALGMTARDILLGVRARAADPSSGGRQLPMHFSHRALAIVSGSSATGTQIPHGVGAALAIRYRGEHAVAITYFGEATTSEGDFHEAMNVAAVHQLPVLFFCENNGYGISVPQALQMHIERAAMRAAAYGMVGVTVDGRDPVAVYGETRRALERALAGEGPTLIEAVCDRMTAHSSDDNETLYRTPEELTAAKARDPLPTFERRLVALGIMTQDEILAVRIQCQRDVDEAAAFAEQSAPPEPADALSHVFASHHQ